MSKATSFLVAPSLYIVRQDVPQKGTTATKPVETPTNHIAVIDCSGSMCGELPQIRQQLKQRLPKLLKEGDTFSVIWFSGRGQFGVLLEAEPVATLTDLKDVERAIDRWLQPQGLTGFKEPLEEVTKLVARVAKKNGNPCALFFMSDGCDNQWGRGDILKAVTTAAGVLAQATFVEYGYYADRPLLTAMAEKAGGQMIHAQDFDAYAPTFEAVVQKRAPGAPRVEVAIQGDPIRGFAWSAQDGDLVTFAVENGKAAVPGNTKSVWYLSPSLVGNECASQINLQEIAGNLGPGMYDGIVMDRDGESVSAAYAALSLFSARMAPEIVLPLLKATGDVTFIDQFGGLFGKQKYSAFMDATKAAVFDSKKRWTKGFDPKKVPAEDAYTVLDVLKLLQSDDENRVLLDDPRFKYARIGRGRVDATQVLTAEDQAKLAALTTELAKAGKNAKKAADITAQIQAITNKPEALKFEALPAPEGYAVSSLTFNEEKPNVSMLVRKTGFVDLTKSNAPKGIPNRFETFVFRNYAIIKDGLVNVAVLPVKISEKTLETLFQVNAQGRLPDTFAMMENGVMLLNLGLLPVINRKMTKTLSAKQLFDDEWKLLGVQAQQKVFNTLLKELAGTKKSEGFVEKYGQEAADWLKEKGFTDYSGFSPKAVQAEATDVYTAKELSVSIKGFSSIPSLNDFKKQAAKGKLTPSAQLMEGAYKEAEAFRATEAGQDPEKYKGWLHAKIQRLDLERRAALAAKAQSVFCTIVGQTWFAEFSSLDENTLKLKTPEGSPIDCKVEMREVEVKI